jgi:hypothetical protein
MSILNRVVTLLLLIWLPITLATAGGLRTCPSHHMNVSVAEHCHEQVFEIAADKALSNHQHDNHSNNSCMSCVVCHISASMPQTLTVNQPNPIVKRVSLWPHNHYRSISLLPADRPPLIVLI